MPIYDHRVFRHKGQWWVAQVHGGSSAGVWGDVNKPMPIQWDSLYFTCVTDEKERTRGASQDIPTGWLNRLRHSVIIRLLEGSRDLQMRLEMDPLNAPNVEELSRFKPFKDKEGLRWVVRDVSGDGPLKMAEVVCLDDSALRKDLLLQDEQTLPALRAAFGLEGDQALVEAVKGTFLDLQPEDQE